MHIKMLIDSIMQQTTLLIGQLSTAAGVRAPLARIADQVFVDLARELESQGVGRRESTSGPTASAWWTRNTLTVRTCARRSLSHPRESGP